MDGRWGDGGSSLSRGERLFRQSAATTSLHSPAVGGEIVTERTLDGGYDDEPGDEPGDKDSAASSVDQAKEREREMEESGEENAG